jgi:hypothetical protein
MLIMAGLSLNHYFADSGGDVEEPHTAGEWVRRAAVLETEGDLHTAELACRAALAREPWHPAASRRLTGILLRQGDGETLYDWMDDLVLGDARQAERYFDQPGFAPWLENEAFRSLHREAVIQAND